MPEQEQPDGDFPTVNSPNPEEREAFELAIELAEREGADIIIGTDPDCDRMGAVVRTTKATYRRADRQPVRRDHGPLFAAQR